MEPVPEDGPINQYVSIWPRFALEGSNHLLVVLSRGEVNDIVEVCYPKIKSTPVIASEASNLGEDKNSSRLLHFF